MQERGWPNNVVLLTNKQGDFVLIDEALMKTQGTELSYLTRSACQKWCLIQTEGEGRPSKQLVDSEATIADMAADIRHHVGYQVTIMATCIGCDGRSWSPASDLGIILAILSLSWTRDAATCAAPATAGAAAAAAASADLLP